MDDPLEENGQEDFAQLFGRRRGIVPEAPGGPHDPALDDRAHLLSLLMKYKRRDARLQYLENENAQLKNQVLLLKNQNLLLHKKVQQSRRDTADVLYTNRTTLLTLCILRDFVVTAVESRRTGFAEMKTFFKNHPVLKNFRRGLKEVDKYLGVVASYSEYYVDQTVTQLARYFSSRGLSIKALITFTTRGYATDLFPDFCRTNTEFIPLSQLQEILKGLGQDDYHDAHDAGLQGYESLRPAQDANGTSEELNAGENVAEEDDAEEDDSEEEKDAEENVAEQVDTEEDAEETDPFTANLNRYLAMKTEVIEQNSATMEQAPKEKKVMKKATEVVMQNSSTTEQAPKEKKGKKKATEVVEQNSATTEQEPKDKKDKKKENAAPKQQKRKREPEPEPEPEEVGSDEYFSEDGRRPFPRGAPSKATWNVARYKKAWVCGGGKTKHDAAIINPGLHKSCRTCGTMRPFRAVELDYGLKVKNRQKRRKMQSSSGVRQPRKRSTLLGDLSAAEYEGKTPKMPSRTDTATHRNAASDSDESDTPLIQKTQSLKHPSKGKVHSAADAPTKPKATSTAVHSASSKGTPVVIDRYFLTLIKDMFENGCSLTKGVRNFQPVKNKKGKAKAIQRSEQ